MIFVCQHCKKFIVKSTELGMICADCNQMINPNKAGAKKSSSEQKPKQRYLVINYASESVRVGVDERDDQELYKAIATELGFEKVILRDISPIEPPRSIDEMMKAEIIATQVYDIYKKIKATDESLKTKLSSK